VESFNVVVQSTMICTLDPDYGDHLEKVAADYSTFVETFKKVKQPGKGRDTVTLKLHIVCGELK